MLRDTAGKPVAVLTDRGGLAPGSPLPIDLALGEPSTEQGVREHGFLPVVGDMDEWRVFRALRQNAAMVKQSFSPQKAAKSAA